jgi:Glycosyl transferase family 2
MYFLSICAIFKNEAHILQEWISHYLIEGVEHFYLIDNGSTDDFSSILGKYIENGIVTLYSDPDKYKQEYHYNNYVLKNHKYDTIWLMVIDLDEFVYSRRSLGYITISDYLHSLDEQKILSVSLKWKMFGSSGHVTQPEQVIPNFTRRHERINENIGHQKAIYLLKEVYRLSTHNASFLVQNEDSGWRRIYSNGKNFEYKNTEDDYPSEELAKHAIHLNHYAIQSYEWFSSVKMIRGDVSNKHHDQVRNNDYFKRFDTNDYQDTELKEKKVIHQK